MSEKCESVLAVVHVPSMPTQVVPPGTFGDEQVLPAEFVWCDAAQSILGVVYDARPFKMGARACFNHKTKLYWLPLKFKEGEKHRDWSGGQPTKYP